MSYKTISFSIDTKKGTKGIDNAVRMQAEKENGIEESRSSYTPVLAADGKTYLYFWVRFLIPDE